RLAGSNPGRVRSWLAESLGVSLAAQAATLPVILLDFGRLSLVSPVVNVLVAPFVAPAMAASAVALAGGLAAAAGLPALVATIVGLPAWFLLGVIIGIVRAGAGLPFASVGLDPPVNLVAAVAAAVAVGVTARWAGRRARGHPAMPPHGAQATATGANATAGAATPPTAGSPSTAEGSRSSARPTRHAGPRALRIVGLLVASALVAVIVAGAHRPDGATRITVMDVGQGDAILIEGGHGGRLLVDGGPDPGRLLVDLDERLPPWDRRIDAVVLTHPHEDHVAGLVALLAHERVGRVFESGLAGPGPGYAAWESELAETNTGQPTRWALATGDTLDVDDVHLRVLWPDPGSLPSHLANDGSAINNESIVLLGEVEGHRFLLTGDMEQDVDPVLIARGLPTVDVLKVAHHGSRTATTQPLLDALRPRIAAISVGAGNSYGHPAAATLERLGAVAGTVLRTDLDGSITITFDGAAVRVQRSGGRRAAWAETASDAAPMVEREAPGPATTLPPPVPRAATTMLPHPAANAGTHDLSRYHRPDDGPVPGGGGPAAPVPRSPGLAPAALARRRRGRGVARPADRRAPATRSGAGRDGRAPP
ncbi:MAG TPA: ComEC/Rec2 family competence protein, partial [Candidatus Limnocylindrales bacterium]